MALESLLYGKQNGDHVFQGQSLCGTGEDSPFLFPVEILLKFLQIISFLASVKLYSRTVTNNEIMMKNSIKKVGTTFLGLLCLLGGVLTFTGCDTYDYYGDSGSYGGSEIYYYDDSWRASPGRPTEDQLKRTYNVDTVKLYEACMKVIIGGSFDSDMQVSFSEKPQRAGESGYISLKKYVARCRTFQGSGLDSHVKFTLYVGITPTFIIEKGSSESTSILKIQPKWSEYRNDGNIDSAYINRDRNYGQLTLDFYKSREKGYIESFFQAVQSNL